tara:strand:+ start:31715 stop:34402 length:2688 start_codon:yes stop_codon:yes gene_type:complete
MFNKINLILIFSIFIIIYIAGFRVYERVINEFELIDYEEFLLSQKYYNEKKLSKKELKKIPKHIRPKPNIEFEKIKTIDPKLRRVPKEKLIEAIRETELRQPFERNISNLQWKERGPANVAGRTRAIMFDPNDSQGKKLWAGGVTGGLWYTDDITSSAPSWNKVDDIWANLAVSSITHDPTNPNIFYVGTGEIYANVSRGFGLWKSEDGGNSWQHLSNTENFYYVNDIVVRNENNQGVLYVGTGLDYYEGQWHYGAHGLYRSTDNGISFDQVLPSALPSNQPYQPSDLEIGPDNSIWVGTRRNAYWEGGGTILKSIDGINWSIVYQNQDSRRVELAVSPSNPSIIYAVGNKLDNFDDDIQFFIKSSDGGGSWQDINIPLNTRNVHFTRGQAWYNLILAVDPLNPSILYAGGIDLFKSNDSGLNWSQISQWYGYPYPYVHADQHAIIFRPGYSQEFAIGNDGGVHYSTDGGLSFENYNNNYSLKNNGYNVTQFYSLAIHPEPGVNQFLAGSQDNGTQFFDEPDFEDTYEISGGDGGWCFFLSNPSYRITSYVYNTYFLYDNFNRVYKILDDQESGHFINPTDYDSINDILYSTKDDTSISRVYNVSSAPYRRNINGVPLITMASSLKVSPHDSNYLLVGTDAGRLFEIKECRSENSIVNELTYPGFPQGYVSSIEFGQTNNDILITFSNYGVSSIWEKDNNSQMWRSLEGDLPDMPIRWAIYNPDNHDFVIAATEVGIWVSNDVSSNSINWTPSTAGGLANVRVDMLKVRESDNLVAAATHGRGLFTTNLSSQLKFKTESSDLPNRIVLSQNAPNPFNNSTNISYFLPKKSKVKLEIFDVKGARIRKLVDGPVREGQHSITWNLKDDNQKEVSAGTYIYKIISGDFTESKTMSYVK